jgi:hypothetical protein
LLKLGGKTNKSILSIASTYGFVSHTYLPMLHLLIDYYRAISVPPGCWYRWIE